MNHQEPDEPRGADLARIALLAAKKEAAKRGEHGRAQHKSTRRPAVTRRDGRAPMGLASVFERLMVERGWEAPAAGGTVIDRWSAIATPQVADRLQAVAFDDATRRLDLLPESSAWRLQGQLIAAELIRKANAEVGEGAVREIRILAPGSRPHRRSDSAPGGEPALPLEPTGRPRQYATDEYRQVRAALSATPARRDDNAPAPARDDQCHGYREAIAGLRNRTPSAVQVPAPVRTEEDRCDGYRAAMAASRTTPDPTPAPDPPPAPHEPPTEYLRIRQQIRDRKVLSSPAT